MGYYGKRKHILGMQYFKRKKMFSDPIREATQVSLENEVRRRQSLKNPAQLFSCQRGSTVMSFLKEICIMLKPLLFLFN